jgi:hypothetical protein
MLIMESLLPNKKTMLPMKKTKMPIKKTMLPCGNVLLGNEHMLFSFRTAHTSAKHA